MALIRMEFFSETLGMCVPATVILPQRSRPSGQKLKTLWLLHGAEGDHTCWTRYTSIERYVAHRELCVIMPSAHMSRYRDMAFGGRFFSYIVDELPCLMREFFPLSDKREDNYIAGLSMGGQGAMRLGLLRPEQYSAIGCLSAGASNYLLSRMKDPAVARSFDLVWGDIDPSNEMQEVLDVANALLEKKQPVPMIYHACGTEDFQLGNARITRDFFQSLPGNPFHYIYEEPSGAHTWAFWDEHIQKFLRIILPEET